MYIIIVQCPKWIEFVLEFILLFIQVIIRYVVATFNSFIIAIIILKMYSFITTDGRTTRMVIYYLLYNLPITVILFSIS